jgi:hypothetical protein
MNFVRTQPLEFVKLLEDMLLFFDGDVYKAEGYEPITTVEGPKAVQEAIDFLR